jgi:hypothetical protein
MEVFELRRSSGLRYGRNILSIDITFGSAPLRVAAA